MTEHQDTFQTDLGAVRFNLFDLPTLHTSSKSVLLLDCKTFKR